MNLQNRKQTKKKEGGLNRTKQNKTIVQQKSTMKQENNRKITQYIIYFGNCYILKWNRSSICEYSLFFFLFFFLLWIIGTNNLICILLCFTLFVFIFSLLDTPIRLCVFCVFRVSRPDLICFVFCFLFLSLASFSFYFFFFFDSFFWCCPLNLFSDFFLLCNVIESEFFIENK